MKILLFIFLSFMLFSCERRSDGSEKECHPELCVDKCIKDMIRRMDDSSFSQNQFNNFNQIKKYCYEKAKYKCADGDGTCCKWWVEFDYNKKSSFKINKSVKENN